MQQQLEQIESEAIRAVQAAQSLEALARVESQFVGKKGSLRQMLRSLGQLPKEQRAAVGQKANQIKQRLTELLAQRRDELRAATAADEAARARMYDPTLPGPIDRLGSVHPVTAVQWEIEDLFARLGFVVATGPEMETEYYNFEALNTPADHPARDMQDTFWLTNGRLLRTQTSAVQVRVLERLGAPLRIICPGRCFRPETVDASHDCAFFQLEGLLVDRDISIANLIGIMNVLVSQIFKRDVPTRLRPGYFPFVEPGFELDIRCTICQGRGCPTCKKSGWVELLPCGMVHPNVLKAGGVDPHEYTGFAFGLGLTRMAMMKYGIGDIRVMNSADLRALVPPEELTGPAILAKDDGPDAGPGGP